MVRWSEDKAFGVEFIKLSPADTKRLAACLAVLGKCQSPLGDERVKNYRCPPSSFHDQIRLRSSTQLLVR
jgi:hypothetical protein